MKSAIFVKLMVATIKVRILIVTDAFLGMVGAGCDGEGGSYKPFDVCLIMLSIPHMNILEMVYLPSAI